MDKMFKVIFFGVFIFIGTSFILSTVAFRNLYYKGMDNCITTKGVISDINDNNTIVTYYVRGKEYVHNFSYYNSSLSIGDKIDICYEKNNINNAVLKNEINVILNIFFYVGCGIMVIPLSGLIIMTLSKKNKKRIKETGTCDRFNISSVEENLFITINNRHPYQIVVRTNINGYDVVFKSENINKPNLERILNENNITSVFVYYDPENYKKYYVDIDEIKSLIK